MRRLVTLSAIGLSVALLMSGCAQKLDLSSNDLKSPKQEETSFSFVYIVGASQKNIKKCNQDSNVEVQSGSSLNYNDYVSSIVTVTDENGTKTHNVEKSTIKDGFEYHIYECVGESGRILSSIKVSVYNVLK